MNRPLIAITGATGFIGGRLISVLTEAGYDVRALTRRAPPGDALQGVAWVRGDLDNDESLRALVKDAAFVVHVAGAIKARNRDAFFAVNADGTRRVAAAAAAQASPPRFIHLSSIAARMPTLSNYAASKRGSEQALRDFDMLRPVILRPPVVYGPGDMETLRIFKMAASGFVFAPAAHRAKFSLVHVDDVARAAIAAMLVDKSPARPVEFDDGRVGGYSWPDLLAAAGSALNRSPRLIPIPSPLVYAAGLGGSAYSLLTGRPNVLSWDKVGELLYGDWVAEGEMLPGYNPLWNIEKGFQDAANWYTSRGLLKSNG
jgi:nucleoside-diphosphate-sugar epimerase